MYYKNDATTIDFLFNSALCSGRRLEHYKGMEKWVMVNCLPRKSRFPLLGKPKKNVSNVVLFALSPSSLVNPKHRKEG